MLKVKQNNLIVVEVFIVFMRFEFYEILKGAPTESPNIPNLINVLSRFRSQKPKIGSNIGSSKERNIGNSVRSRI